MSSRRRRAARIGTRVLIGVVVALAVVAGIAASGMARSRQTALRHDPVAAPAAGWPQPATAPPARPDRGRGRGRRQRLGRH